MSKAKFFFLPLLGLAALLAGCGPSITNLTSNPVPQNPSGIYEISMSVDNMDNSLVKGSFKPYVVIDGEARPMQQSDIGKDIYKYNFAMPEGRNAARYYFILDYQTDFKGDLKDKQAQSGKVYTLALTNRYVITLEAYRGPVGSSIPVVGRGFSKSDKVVIGGFEAETTYYSPTSLSFVVPPLPAGDTYRVEISTGSGLLSVGNFQVDPAKLSVSHSSLSLSSGQREVLVVKIDFAAPQGGLPIDVTTDIPQSVVMPEVAIPAGAMSVSVPIEGGMPGSGSLFVSAPGFSEVRIPVNVVGVYIQERSVDVIQPSGDQVIVEEAEVIQID
ncbi:IPT/TIG domain-containing protein [Ruficoccus amylovorans]|uniref:IPT/TIG domain-containing protein n=1 Tax=Ruficoccus amylovorans TaxID=1804625 RepID=A0A842HI78_9BACT|nr:IPT/TIG domain-containing protein [Ruficoccus amylovorans]MBC2596059.1 IPT/TIG domain-containing protein [Ruficoccus amylovorans]